MVDSGYMGTEANIGNKSRRLLKIEEKIKKKIEGNS